MAKLVIRCAALTTLVLMMVSIIILSVNAKAVMISNSLNVHETSLHQPDEAYQNKNLLVSIGREKRSNTNQRSTKNKKKRTARRKGKKQDQTEHTGALHFVIDVSPYSQDDLLTGQTGDVIPYWKLADNGLNYHHKYAVLNRDGTLTVKQPGLYMIYTQVTYYDNSGRWSHLVDINSRPFIKCLATEWGIDTDPNTGLHFSIVHQCYTSAVTYLKRNDVVSIKSMYPDRIIHTDRDMTFWGIIKFA